MEQELWAAGGGPHGDAAVAASSVPNHHTYAVAALALSHSSTICRRLGDPMPHGVRPLGHRCACPRPTHQTRLTAMTIWLTFHSCSPSYVTGSHVHSAGMQAGTQAGRWFRKWNDLPGNRACCSYLACLGRWRLAVGGPRAIMELWAPTRTTQTAMNRTWKKPWQTEGGAAGRRMAAARVVLLARYLKPPAAPRCHVRAHARLGWLPPPGQTAPSTSTCATCGGLTFHARDAPLAHLFVAL